MFVAFVLMLEAVVFYILYAQMPTSLNFFAIKIGRASCRERV